MDGRIWRWMRRRMYRGTVLMGAGLALMATYASARPSAPGILSIAVSSPQDCSVKTLSSSQTLQGTFTDASLTSLTVQLFNDASPTGLNLTVTQGVGTFSAPGTLAVGDNQWVVTAINSQSEVMTRTIHQAYFPTGSILPYTLRAQTSDGQSVQADYEVDGNPVELPTGIQVVDGERVYLKATGVEHFAEFGVTPNPKKRYVYSVADDTLTAITDGCERSIQIIYPSVTPSIPVRFEAVDSGSAALPGAQFVWENGSLTENLAIVPAPESVGLKLKLRYGISEVVVPIDGGIQPGETVTYIVATGVLERAVTPGTTLVQVIAEPATVLVENQDQNGTPLPAQIRVQGEAGARSMIHAKRSEIQGLIGGHLTVRSEYNGFGHQTALWLQKNRSYQVSARDRQFIVGDLASGGPYTDRVIFVYHLAQVPLKTETELGAPFFPKFKTLSALQSISGTLPTVLQLGIGTQARVEIQHHGFAANMLVEIFEDHERTIDLKNVKTTERFDWGRPSLRWQVAPIQVGFEVLDAAQNPIAGAVAGVVHADGPQGVAPLSVELLDGTSGVVFTEVGTQRIEVPIQVQAGKTYDVDAATGEVTMSDTVGGETRVRFHYGSLKK